MNGKLSIQIQKCKWHHIECLFIFHTIDQPATWINFLFVNNIMTAHYQLLQTFEHIKLKNIWQKWKKKTVSKIVNEMQFAYVQSHSGNYGCINATEIPFSLLLFGYTDIRVSYHINSIIAKQNIRSNVDCDRQAKE